MGKVHRIKRRFHKALRQPVQPFKWLQLGDGVSMYIGERYDKSRYVHISAWGEAYKGLRKHLERVYNAGAR